MSARELASRIKFWTKMYSFCSDVDITDKGTHIEVSFRATTTKTRASTIVTRMNLITQEVLPSTTSFVVDKECLSEQPPDRAALATWKIYVSIQKRKIAA